MKKLFILALLVWSLPVQAEDNVLRNAQPPTNPREALLGKTGKIDRGLNPYRNTPKQGYIETSVDEEFSLQLPLTRGDGYSWVLAAPLDANFLEQSGVDPNANFVLPHNVGKAHGTAMTFKAKAQGRTQIRVAYKRNGSNQAVMEKIFVIIIG